MRASVYLCERCESLYQSLIFFQKSGAFSNHELGLIFLAQIDFWDFEVESLLFLFQSFAERQDDWNTTSSIAVKLHKKGLIIKNHYLGEVAKKRYWRRQKTIYSPDEMLHKVIDQWNKLLEQYAYLLISEKDQKSAEQCGVPVKKLSSYRKTISQDFTNVFNQEEENDKSQD